MGLIWVKRKEKASLEALFSSLSYKRRINQSEPIREHYLAHMITLDQSEVSILLTASFSDSSKVQKLSWNPSPCSNRIPRTLYKTWQRNLSVCFHEAFVDYLLTICSTLIERLTECTITAIFVQPVVRRHARWAWPPSARVNILL